MKKTFMFITLIASFVFSAGVRAEITKIKNVQNVGIYTIDENVSFEITRDNEENEDCFFKIMDIDGNIVAERSFVSDEKTDVFSLGYFPVGWYRVKAFCGGIESNVFASFSVIQKNDAEASNKLSPFSIMHLGRLADGKHSDYVEAFRRLAVGSVRTEEIADIYKNNRPYFKYNKTLYDAGIDSMATVATNSADIAGLNLLDVYDVHKTMVDAYGEAVSVWELINEPDHVNGLSGDAFSSWFKAAVLAVSDSQPDAIKGFGGLANPNSSYLDILMQNEIMKYSDTLNVHGHSQDTEKGAVFQKNRVNIGKIYSAIYADNAPVWCTEAGLAMEVEDSDNELPSDAALRRQARYMINSFMQILEAGADKNFWFFAPHYTSEGPEYGTFSKNHMPYPAISSLNILTDNLKDGILLGTVKPDIGIDGYFFDCGEYDAAVVWTTALEKGSIQLCTDGNVSVVNLIGNTDIKNYSSATGKVSVNISKDPVVIKFAGKSNPDDYVKTAVKRNLPVPHKMTNPEDRIVLQQIWVQKPEVSNGHYRINDSAEYDVQCRIYNFNNTDVSGSYSIENTEGIRVYGDISGNYDIPANSYTEKNITVRVDSDGEIYSTENLAFYAQTSDGSKVSPSISQVRIFLDEYSFDDAEINVIEAANYYSANQGDTYVSQSKPAISNPYIGSNAQSVKYKSAGIKNSTIPAQVYIYQNNLNVDKDSEGMYFEFTCDKFPDGFEGTYFDVNVIGEEGRFNFNDVFRFDANTKNKKVYIPWGAFVNSSANVGITDPSAITTFHFGWNISTDSNISLDFTIENMGTYKTKNTEDLSETIKISGVSNSGEYITANTKAAIETYDTATTEIYVNYEKVDCAADDNGVFCIDFSEYEPGNYSLIAVYKNDFNKKVYKEVKFILTK